METPIRGDEQKGLNRRDVLRRGAILGGAMVWTVPAVQTIAGPAFAVGTACAFRFEAQTIDGDCLFFTEYQETEACCACTTAVIALNPSAAPAAGFICSLTGECIESANGPC